MSARGFGVAVIGAGFSGMVAAISLKRICPGADVVIYEGTQRAGKKILVTGNGRCNLTNRNFSPEFYNGDKELLANMCREGDNEKLLEFFASLGLVCKEDFAGRVYPSSNQAASVLDALRFALQKYDIKLVTEEKITSLEKKAAGYVLNGSFYADYVVFACGGKAASVHGSDGSGLELLKSKGVSITPLFPSLVPLYIDGFTKSLKGIRAQGRVTISDKGTILASDTGEIQYTDYGLSGIPVFQISGAVVRQLSKGKAIVSVDGMPSMTQEQLSCYIRKVKKDFPFMPGENLLSGIMPKKLGMYYLSLCSLAPSKPCSAIADGAADKLASVIKSKKYNVSHTGGFSDAQVTAGGVKSSEINTFTGELKKLPKAFVCGEMLDVDGLCGGYNLQWCFSSAVCVAEGIAKEIKSASHK